MTAHQNIADRVKAVLDSAAPQMSADQIVAAYTALLDFERRQHNPHLLHDLAPDFDAVIAGGVNAVIALLTAYNAAVPPPDNPPPLLSGDLLTTAEAAALLGLSEAGFRKYVYQHAMIAPVQRIGRVLLFARDDVERLDTARRSPGRPRNE